MARPIKSRRVCQMPKNVDFAPCSKAKTAVVEMAIDEYECIRLIDYLSLTQEECAAQMNVARTTVQAIYDSARKKISDVLINGKRLVISGGCYNLCENAERCCGKDCKENTCRGKRCKDEKEQCLQCQKQKEP
ncbi:MAG: DUF134 domain-containing protein [Oscillospiraceae bacterium]